MVYASRIWTAPLPTTQMVYWVLPAVQLWAATVTAMEAVELDRFLMMRHEHYSATGLQNWTMRPWPLLVCDSASIGASPESKPSTLYSHSCQIDRNATEIAELRAKARADFLADASWPLAQRHIWFQAKRCKITGWRQELSFPTPPACSVVHLTRLTLL